MTASANPSTSDQPLTAAVILIGNEILSGRTHDVNLPAIANALSARGIAVAEARVIADIPETIRNTINELRAAHNFVFTTGGIGCLLYTSPSPRDKRQSRMPSSA